MTGKDETSTAKPAKFDGTHFKRWQSQMRFWLTTLGLMSAIDGSTPIINDSDDTESDIGMSKSSGTSKPKTPKEIDFHCFHRILSALSDSLYDIFFEYKSAKELWDALEDEYACDDAGIERSTSSAFNRYFMVDDKPMNEQIHEFQKYVRHIQAKGTTFSPEHKIACLIDKLPPSWSDIKRDLTHTQGDLTFAEVLKKIRTEEQLRLRSNPKTETKAKVNLVESPPHKPKPSNPLKPKKNFVKKKLNFQQNHKNRHQQQNHRPRNVSQTQDQQKFCLVCGRTNHLSFNCFQKKKEPIKTPYKGKGPAKPEANMILGGSSVSFRNHVEET
ncbi:uncharacterized protein M6B38_281755 [Iris pallida]|uniref:Uncharacterized protein n=1 Tax=Iris pallida TaxID=29817 RepID=A0AAX6I3B8_IRIPA|nr:uncharacterized protein M6B38_281755 [Iris pallida]